MRHTTATAQTYAPRCSHAISDYPDDFQRDHAGVAELHHLDLDFAGPRATDKAMLVLHGWVDWADGSTFLAATQAHRDLVFPYLQMKDAGGNWKTVIEDMGIPSGKPKPMAVDLTGKFLCASREVRIVTNLCVYWDEIYLYENNAAPESAHRAFAEFRRLAFPRLLARHHRPAAQAARSVRLSDGQPHFHVESHGGQLHALWRRAANCCGNPTIAW